MKQTAKSHLFLIIFHIQHPGQTYSMPFDKCHTNGLRQQLLQAHEKFDDSETKEEKKRAREKTGSCTEMVVSGLTWYIIKIKFVRFYNQIYIYYISKLHQTRQPNSSTW